MATIDTAVILFDTNGNSWDTAYGSCTLNLTEVPVAMTDHAGGATMNAMLTPEGLAKGTHTIKVTLDVPHS
jgi:hypothetical protein